MGHHLAWSKFLLCRSEGVTWNPKPYGAKSIASNPQPLDVSETTNITICENSRGWGERRVVFLVCSLLYHDNHQQRYFTLHVLAYFRLLLLLQCAFLNFWPSKDKFNIKPPHWSVRIYLIREIEPQPPVWVFWFCFFFLTMWIALLFWWLVDTTTYSHRPTSICR